MAQDHGLQITTGCACRCQTLYVNSKVPWSCRGAALFFSFHNWHSLSCAFNRLAERRIMPVKTAGVFSIRGVTLSHKQIPCCSLCWHQPPHQHNNKNCIFDETFRSQKKRSAQVCTVGESWPTSNTLNSYSTEKKHMQKVSACEVWPCISLLADYLFKCFYWKLALKDLLCHRIQMKYLLPHLSYNKGHLSHPSPPIPCPYRQNRKGPWVLLNWVL